MKKISSYLITIIVFFLFGTGISFAGTLRVEPACLLIQNVVPGELYDIYEISGMTLKIHNKDKRAHTYLLSTHKPSTVGNRKWTKGYLEIPDPSWYWFEKSEVWVDAEAIGEVKMFFRIPEEEKYYNQHWVVTLEVKAKPEAGISLALAIYPQMQIETQSKEGLDERLAGSIGLEPDVICLENLSLGTKEKKELKIYNNDSKKHRYKITAMKSSQLTKINLFSSPEYEWLPEPKWISPNRKRINIGAGESRTISLKIYIPKRPEYCNQKWEGILFVEPDEGLSGFVRVQIETEEKDEKE